MGTYLSTLLRWKRADYGLYLDSCLHNDEVLYYLYFHMCREYMKTISKNPSSHPHQNSTNSGHGDVDSHAAYLMHTPMLSKLRWTTFLTVDDVMRCLKKKGSTWSRLFSIRDVNFVEAAEVPAHYLMCARGTNHEASVENLRYAVLHFSLLIASKLGTDVSIGEVPPHEDVCNMVENGKLRAFLIGDRLVPLCRGGRSAYQLVVAELRSFVVTISKCCRDSATEESVRKSLSQLLHIGEYDDVYVMNEALHALAKRSMDESELDAVPVARRAHSSFVLSRGTSNINLRTLTPRNQHHHQQQQQQQHRHAVVEGNACSKDTPIAKPLHSLVPDAEVLRDPKWDSYNPEEIALQLKREMLGADFGGGFASNTSDGVAGADASRIFVSPNTVGTKILEQHSLQYDLDNFEKMKERHDAIISNAGTEPLSEKSHCLEEVRARKHSRQVNFEKAAQEQRSIDADAPSDEDDFQRLVITAPTPPHGSFRAQSSPSAIPLIGTGSVGMSLGAFPSMVASQIIEVTAGGELKPTIEAMDISEEQRVRLVAFHLSLRNFELSLLAQISKCSAFLLEHAILSRQEMEWEVQSAIKLWSGSDDATYPLKSTRWMQHYDDDKVPPWTAARGVYGKIQVVFHNPDTSESVVIVATDSGYYAEHPTGGCKAKSIVDALLERRNCNPIEANSLPVSALYPSLRTLLCDVSRHFAEFPSNKFPNPTPPALGTVVTVEERPPAAVPNQPAPPPHSSARGFHRLAMAAADTISLDARSNVATSSVNLTERPMSSAAGSVSLQNQQQAWQFQKMMAKASMAHEVGEAKRRITGHRGVAEEVRRQLNRQEPLPESVTAENQLMKRNGSRRQSGASAIDAKSATSGQMVRRSSTICDEVLLTSGDDMHSVSDDDTNVMAPRPPPVDVAAVTRRLYNSMTQCSVTKVKPKRVYTGIVKRTAKHDVATAHKERQRSLEHNEDDSATAVAVLVPMDAPDVVTTHPHTHFLLEAVESREPFIECALTASPDTLTWEINLARESFSVEFLGLSVEEAVAKSTTSVTESALCPLVLDPTDEPLTQTFRELTSQVINAGDNTNKGQVQRQWLQSLAPPVSVPQALFALTSLLEMDCAVKHNHQKIVKLRGPHNLTLLLQEGSQMDLRVRLSAAKLLVRLTLGARDDFHLIPFRTIETQVRDTLATLKTSLSAGASAGGVSVSLGPQPQGSVSSSRVMTEIDVMLKSRARNFGSGTQSAAKTDYVVQLLLLLAAQSHVSLMDDLLTACGLCLDVVTSIADSNIMCAALFAFNACSLMITPDKVPRHTLEVVASQIHRLTVHCKGPALVNESSLLLYLLAVPVGLSKEARHRETWRKTMLYQRIARFLKKYVRSVADSNNLNPHQHAMARRVVLQAFHVMSLYDIPEQHTSVQSTTPIGGFGGRSADAVPIAVQMLESMLAPVISRNPDWECVGTPAIFARGQPVRPGMSAELQHDTLLFLVVLEKFLCTAYQTPENDLNNRIPIFALVLVDLSSTVFPEARGGVTGYMCESLVQATQIFALRLLEKSLDVVGKDTQCVYAQFRITDRILDLVKENPKAGMAAQLCSVLARIASVDDEARRAVRNRGIIILAPLLHSSNEDVMLGAADAISVSITSVEEAAAVSHALSDALLPLGKYLREHTEETCAYLAKLLSRLAWDSHTAHTLVDIGVVQTATMQMLRSSSPLAHEHLCNLLCSISAHDGAATVSVINSGGSRTGSISVSGQMAAVGNSGVLPLLLQLIRKAQLADNVPLLCTVTELLATLAKNGEVCAGLTALKAGGPLVGLLAHRDHRVQDAAADTLQCIRSATTAAMASPIV